MTALDELIQKIEGMSPVELKELDKQILEDPEFGNRWTPNAGPQYDAYISDADVLLYGGQAGGGKSGLIIGLALTRHKRSLLMRRQYTDLGALIDDCLDKYGTKVGFSGQPPARLKTKDERLIEFGAAKMPGDEEHWKGQPHDLICVGRGTPVRMGDGSQKPIEDIAVGDFVETLEGPRRVTKTFPPMLKLACRLEVYDDGELVATQVQSRNHEFLTSAGWVSRDTFYESHPSLILAPTGHRLPHTSSLGFWSLCGELSLFLRQTIGRLGHMTLLPSTPPYRWGVSVMPAFDQPTDRGIDYGASYGGHPAFGRLALLLRRLGLVSRHRDSGVFDFSGSSSSCDGNDAQRTSLPEGSLWRYWFGTRQCDERTPASLGPYLDTGAFQAYLHRSSGVEQSIPSGLQGDVSDNTPRHTHRIDRYPHPYRTETRSVCAGGDTGSFVFHDLGVEELFDIEVEDVNHYINCNGLVNKNCLDEASQFLESQVRFLLGWLRSTTPGQRCRAILATNPPDKPAEGQWLVKMFGPWLDPSHHLHPTPPGKLQWVVSDADGSDMWVEGPEEVMVGGRLVKPSSRTFVPASLQDNPFLAKTEYARQLDGLPEPLRSAIRDGNWMIAHDDDPFQVIPTNWVIAAQERWTRDPPNAPMCSMGVDVALGGSNNTVIAPRYDCWFDEITSIPGVVTQTGRDIAAEIIKVRRNRAIVSIDMGGGYGSGAYECLKENIEPEAVLGFKGGEAVASRTKDRLLPFANKRAEVYWRFREALDPDQEGGSPIMLPPDSELAADLVSVRRLDIDTTRGKIQLELKEKQAARLGRSPDKGDAVVMAWATGPKYLTHGEIWKDMVKSRHKPRVVMGHLNRKRRR